MHVALAVVGRQRVEPLLHLEHVERGDAENLRLAALEQRRTVHTREDVDLSCQHADIARAASVDAHLVAQHALTHAVLGDAAQSGADLLLTTFETIRESRHDISLDVIQGTLTLGLAHDRQSLGNTSGRDVSDGVVDILRVVGEERELGHRLGGRLGELLLCLAQGADERLGRLQAIGHDRLGGRGSSARDEVDRLVGGLGLDHHDRDVIADNPAGDDHVEDRPLKFRVTREGHPLAVDEGDAHAADRAGEGQTGDLRRCGRRIDGEDVVQIVRIEGEDRHYDLDLVAQALDKGRTQGAVDEAAGEDRILGGTPLATEERAGDPAHGIHPLLHVDGQGEEVEVLLGLLRGRSRAEHHGVVVEVGGDTAAGLTGQPAGFESDGALAEAAVVEDGLGGGYRTLHGYLLSMPVADGDRGAHRARDGLRSRPTGPYPEATTEDRSQIGVGRREWMSSMQLWPRATMDGGGRGAD